MSLKASVSLSASVFPCQCLCLCPLSVVPCPMSLLMVPCPLSPVPCPLPMVLCPFPCPLSPVPCPVFMWEFFHGSFNGLPWQRITFNAYLLPKNQRITFKVTFVADGQPLELIIPRMNGNGYLSALIWTHATDQINGKYFAQLCM